LKREKLSQQVKGHYTTHLSDLYTINAVICQTQPQEYTFCGCVSEWLSQRWFGSLLSTDL